MATYLELQARPGIEMIHAPTLDHIGAFALHLVGTDQEYRKTTDEPLLSSETTGIARDVASIFSSQFPNDSALIVAYRQAVPHLYQFLPIVTSADEAEAVTSDIDGLQADLLLAVPYNEDPQRITDALTAQPEGLADDQIISIKNSLFEEATGENQGTDLTTSEPVEATSIQGQEMEIKTPGRIAEDVWIDFSRLGSKPNIPYALVRAIFPDAAREFDKQGDKRRGSGGKMMVEREQILEYLIAKHSKNTDGSAVRRALVALMNGGE